MRWGRLAPLAAFALAIATGSNGRPAHAATPPEEETVHVVLPGETLGGIANRAKVPRILIAEANGLREPFSLRDGQKLKIPRTGRHKVKAGETSFDIAYRYGVTWKDIAVANNLKSAHDIKAGQVLLIPTLIPADEPATASSQPAARAVSAAKTPARTSAASMAAPISAVAFKWPVEGKVRRGFASRESANHHDGIDIPAAAGSAVRAAAAGTVIFAGEKDDYGNLVILQHEGKWHTAYGFLSRITVTKGEAVNQGERIGLVGNTGLAKGHELHFEVRRDNVPVDPQEQLPATP